MSDFLETVVRERRAYVAAARAWKPLEQVINVARRTAMSRGPGRFARTLRERRAAGTLAVIAEVKRHSPALGPLGAIDDPGRLAFVYGQAGAAAISVLVEPQHWRGSIDDVVAVRSVERGVGWGVPILAKDVTVDEYQIAEAGAAGADAVLLIAEALSESDLVRLILFARDLGMDALVEAHEADAFSRAVRAEEATRDAAGAALSVGTETLLGVNARDLRQPSRLDRGTIHLLAPLAPRGPILVAESGITSVEDAEALPLRVDAVLVGTALVQASDPTPLVRALSGARPGRALA
ncbi:MAG: indole-3-glycerol-phosphate synthase [Chloroflexota bacterium]